MAGAGGENLRWFSAITVGLLIVGLLLIWSLRGDDVRVIGHGAAVQSDAGGWVDVGPVPLSDRQRSALVADGVRVYVIGGASLADAATRGAPMTEGAVLDLATGEWRSLPPLPLALDGPSATIAGGQLVVGGRSCTAFVVAAENDGCHDPTSTYVALNLADIAEGWVTLPEPHGDDQPHAVGEGQGTAVFHRPGDNLLDIVDPDGPTRSTTTPVGMLRGVVCASPLGPLALDAAGRAWTLDLETLTWSPPRSARDLGTQQDARVTLCAPEGGILADSQGRNALHFDQRADAWVHVPDVPVPLGFQPLAASTGSTTHVMVTDPAQARTSQVTFDAEHATWAQAQLPTDLALLWPENLQAGEGTTVVLTAEATGQRLWVSRSADEG